MRTQSRPKILPAQFEILKKSTQLAAWPRLSAVLAGGNPPGPNEYGEPIQESETEYHQRFERQVEPWINIIAAVLGSNGGARQEHVSVLRDMIRDMEKARIPEFEADQLDELQAQLPFALADDQLRELLPVWNGEAKRQNAVLDRVALFASGNPSEERLLACAAAVIPDLRTMYRVGIKLKNLMTSAGAS